MKNIIWTVRIINAPTVLKYCKRCGAKTKFASSGLFRVNAQQKSLDVWLIYKCQNCDTTWNLTVLSRVAPRSIPTDTLRGFHENDSGLAMRYAADTALIKRNGAEPGLPEIEVTGIDVTPDEPVRIHIIAPQPPDIKVESILRKKLGLSRSGLEKLLSEGKLECLSGHDLRKCRLAGEVVVELKQE